MQAKHTIILINTLFLFAWIFGLSGNISYSISIAAVLAVIALVFHWYKNIMINRLMLIAYVSTIFIVLSGIVASYILLPLYFMPLSLYLLVVAIGIYTTFWTKAGLVGVEGKNQTVIRRASLVVLSVIIIVPMLISFFFSEGYPRNLSPFFVFFLMYEIARRYAEDAQHIDEVE